MSVLAAHDADGNLQYIVVSPRAHQPLQWRILKAPCS